jgi:uncharacterized protein (DUF3084 family)
MAHFIKDTGFKTNMNGMENIFLHSMMCMKVNGEMEKKMAVSEATKKIEKERDDLANTLKIKETEKELQKKTLTEQYLNELREKDAIIKHKDEEIALRKDMKIL